MSITYITPVQAAEKLNSHLNLINNTELVQPYAISLEDSELSDLQKAGAYADFLRVSFSSMFENVFDVILSEITAANNKDLNTREVSFENKKVLQKIAVAEQSISLKRVKAENMKKREILFKAQERLATWEKLLVKAQIIKEYGMQLNQTEVTADNKELISYVNKIGTKKSYIETLAQAANHGVIDKQLITYGQHDQAEALQQLSQKMGLFKNSKVDPSSEEQKLRVALIKALVGDTMFATLNVPTT